MKSIPKLTKEEECGREKGPSHSHTSCPSFPFICIHWKDSVCDSEMREVIGT